MKKCATLLIAAALLAGWDGSAMTIDFKVSGEWLVGFGAGTGELYSHFRENNSSPKEKSNTNDIFEANQRVRLQLDAVASEDLSGTLGIEIGDQRWGMADQGGALGADSSNVIKVKNAYIDWLVPDTELRVSTTVVKYKIAYLKWQIPMKNDHFQIAKAVFDSVKCHFH